MQRNKQNDPGTNSGETGMEHEAEKIREKVSRDMPLYHADPDPDVLVDEDPQAPNGMFGDHQDDFDIG